MGTWAQAEKRLGVQASKNLAIQNYFSVETSHSVMTSIYLEATYIRAIGPIKLLGCRFSRQSSGRGRMISFRDTFIEKQAMSVFNFLNKALNKLVCFLSSSSEIQGNKSTNQSPHVSQLQCVHLNS